ncbi:S41 family peptidase [Candidatus Woesebacteria bacterium]|nr:S41 family peptidase [Candidatus Woesebacteria bacterium]
MKLSLRMIQQLSGIALLVVLGIFIEHRFSVADRWLTANSSRLGSTNNAELVNTTVPAERKEVDFSTFWEVWSILERDYIKPEQVVTAKMVDGAIAGMTASLDDPYTMYLPPVENERSGQDLAGAFFGVGIELGFKDQILAVISPLPDTPAAVAGVEAGDLIIKVTDKEKGIDEDTAGWSIEKAVEAIRGPRGSTVVLTLVREGKSEPFTVSLQRGEIVVKSAELEFVEHAGKRVAHIKLSRFGERTDTEWDSLVNTILKEKGSIAGVVLDMRNNPGGFFDGAIKVASEFIDDETVVIQKGKYAEQDFSSRGSARLRNIPIEVLVNKGSASASEIVAGALRDQLGAKLVGEKTFGKGTVQDRRELSNGGGIHVTVAQWMLPKGEWIHETGIPVDVEVSDDRETEADEQLLKAIEVL